MTSSCNTITVRPLAGDEWPLYRALRLRSLADAPAAFGSTLAAEQDRADADWAWRLGLAATSGRDRPLVAELDGAAAGLAWAKFDAHDPQVVNLFQMWVAPEGRGQGAAAALLADAVAWARSRNARTMQLGVTEGNDAARKLYERAGFCAVGVPQPVRPGDARLEQMMRLAL
ncbi:MAG: family N-acetyltransferase [Massilia sp.]|jgi:GNAT superfamily N-acetyltransferase|nr:family N-acetyltransferase [Massilia sp.]MDB5792069.1 family N-acetyltransferase [Massilia sp.]